MAGVLLSAGAARSALFGILCSALAVAVQSEAARASHWIAEDEADRSVALIQHAVRAKRSLSPHGWLQKRSIGYKAYFDLHIPKTSGTSFGVDVRQVLPEHEGYFAQEMCLYGPMGAGKLPGDEIIAFVRDPTSHIYSQFLECKYDTGWWIARQVADDPIMENVTTWLRHFDGGREHDEPDTTCYDPYNMQTRALTCEEPAAPSGRTSHYYQGEPNLTLALKSLDSLFFVGVTDLYHESVCMFFAKTHADQPLPHHCNCADPDAWNAWTGSHSVHSVPAHSNSDLSEEDLRMIGELSRLDTQLYEHALARFREEAAEVERRTGTKLLCED